MFLGDLKLRSKSTSPPLVPPRALLPTVLQATPSRTAFHTLPNLSAHTVPARFSSQDFRQKIRKKAHLPGRLSVCCGLPDGEGPEFQRSRSPAFPDYKDHLPRHTQVNVPGSSSSMPPVHQRRQQVVPVLTSRTCIRQSTSTIGAATLGSSRVRSHRTCLAAHSEAAWPAHARLTTPRKFLGGVPLQQSMPWCFP